MEIDVAIPDFAELGAQRVAINTANGLSRRGYQVRVVVFDGRGAFRRYLDDRVDVLVLGERAWNVPKFRVVLWLLIYLRLLPRRRRVLISFSPITNLLVLLPRLLMPRFIRCIIQEHAYQSVALKDRSATPWWIELFYRLLLVRLYSRADCFLTISEAIRRDFIDSFGIPRDKTQVIANPLDVAQIGRLSKHDVQGFAFAPGVPYLIGVGRLVGQKNFSRLVRIFAEVRALGRDVRLVLVGSGPEDESLHELVHRLGLDDVVHFSGFQINPYAWMARSTLFCLTSNWEGLPQVIAEAMICGVPVVARACPSGPEEMIVDGATGVLVRYDSEPEFVSAIIDLLDHPGKRQTMAENAYVWACQAYSMRCFLALYEDLLARIQWQ